MWSNDGNHSNRLDHADPIFAFVQSSNRPESEDQKENQDRHRPHEAPFFRKYWKDKIGVVRRQKIELALCPISVSFAPELPTAYSNLGLDHMISSS